jgi:uncharacterized Tic20 family protein
MSFEAAPPPPSNPTQSQLTPKQERTWSIWCHVGPLIAGFVSVPSFIVPLVIMLTMGKQSARVRKNSVESLNFQINLWILAIALAVPFFYMIAQTSETVWNLGIVFVLLIFVGIALAIASLALQIVAAIRANEDEDFRYPMIFRFVK